MTDISPQKNAAIKPIIMWFRQDLRLSDNEALYKAIETGRPIIPLFILDEDTQLNNRALGGAAKWWLHHSLRALKNDLPDLCLRKGNAIPVLRKVIEESSAQLLFFNQPFNRSAIEEASIVHELLKVENLSIYSYNGNLLNNPADVLNKLGKPYQIFTPFWNHCLKKTSREQPRHRPKNFLTFKVTSDNLDHWELLPKSPNWAADFKNYWCPGEKGAHEQLSKFIKHSLCDYHTNRNYPALAGTSRLSPHLHWGEISPNQLWYAIHATNLSHRIPGQAIDSFLSEIGWREFSYYTAYHFPNIRDQPLRPEFKNFPWLTNEDHLKAWQKGLTGYPIVDAGMRELWTTGWMHNRVRMIAASFLTKHLLIPWQEGERWFWDTLVDADIACNAVNWQWVAGCGIDAAPYFRIFNPVLQGEKFDPQGTYIRKWVPELSRMPDTFIHKPWLASQSILHDSRVTLGTTYPFPLVDHNRARLYALDAYEALKRKPKVTV